eukprot:gene30965-40293_t
MPSCFSFNCDAVDLNLFAREATWKFLTTVDIDVPAAQVWTKITLDDWSDWHPEVSRINWKTPKPHNAASSRSVRFYHWFIGALELGPVTIDEQFLVWTEGEQMVFHFTRVNRPRFMSFLAGMEDFKVEPLGESKARFTRKVYLKPSLLVRGLGCILRPVFDGIFAKASKNLKLRLEGNVEVIGTKI